MTKADQNIIQEVILGHLTRYPYMHVQDLYKLLLQSARGCEHGVGDIGKARTWLEREVTVPDGGPDEPLVDPISTDGFIVRLHLRPYLQAGKDIDQLLIAFVRTAREHRGSSDILVQYGKLAGNMAEDGLIPFHAEDILSYWSDQESQGFKAVHHSEIYQKLYRPSYRVIDRQFLEEL
jgi:hypothetical protein